jgi:hypothetical protein
MTARPLVGPNAGFWRTLQAEFATAFDNVRRRREGRHVRRPSEEVDQAVGGSARLDYAAFTALCRAVFGAFGGPLEFGAQVGVDAKVIITGLCICYIGNH